MAKDKKDEKIEKVTGKNTEEVIAAPPPKPEMPAGARAVRPRRARVSVGQYQPRTKASFTGAKRIRRP